tara:strand:+ start:2799 stop:3284 length:486 start_codon:yes stop_codon:yes gene_type:complete
MPWGYVIGAIGGAIVANDAKKREASKKRQVRGTVTEGILDLQPLYGQYREDAARAAGLKFTQQGLITDQAQSAYMSEMSGYGRTGLAGYSNPALGDPTARLASIGLQGEAGLLQQSQALEQRLGTIDAAERQLRAQALQQGVTLDETSELIRKDNIKKGSM